MTKWKSVVLMDVDGKRVYALLEWETFDDRDGLPIPAALVESGKRECEHMAGGTGKFWVQEPNMVLGEEV